MTVDVVLPCLDEAGSLPGVLRRLPSGYRAVVADNGSTDGSGELARRLGAYVVDVPQRGYGAAVQAGLRVCTSDVVAVMDADGTLDPGELPKVVAPVVAGTADLALGRRRPSTPTAWPLPARVANATLVRLLRRRTGLPIRDLAPMRAARRQALLDLGVTDRRAGYPLELLLRSAAAGWRVGEVDVAYFPRTPGSRSKVSGSLLGAMRAARDLRRVLAG